MMDSGRGREVEKQDIERRYFPMHRWRLCELGVSGREMLERALVARSIGSGNQSVDVRQRQFRDRRECRWESLASIHFLTSQSRRKRLVAGS